MNPAMMDEATFRRLSDACLERAQTWLEDFDPDELDLRSADGVLTLELASGARFVLNRQSAARQMWYAAGARAWHYGWEPESRTWRDDKDRHELFANVARTISEDLQRAVQPPR